MSAHKAPDMIPGTIAGREPYTPPSLPRAPEWMADAACARTDPEAFFPEKGSGADARKICADCPVRQQCLDMALNLRRNPDGIWGGTTMEERRAMRAHVVECAVCGVEFEMQAANAIYCSDKCRRTARTRYEARRVREKVA